MVLDEKIEEIIKNDPEKQKILKEIMQKFMSDFQTIRFEKIGGTYELMEMKKIFLDYLKRQRLDYVNFFKKLSLVKKMSERDAEILLCLFQGIDYCMIDDLELLHCLYSKHFDSIRKCTVFKNDRESVEYRRTKILNKMSYTKYRICKNSGKRTKIKTFNMPELTKELDFSLQEYQAFLWLRAIKGEMFEMDSCNPFSVWSNPFSVWMVVLNYLMLRKSKGTVLLFLGINHLDVKKAVESLFVEEPDSLSLLKTLFYLYKKCDESVKKELGPFKIRFFKTLEK